MCGVTYKQRYAWFQQVAQLIQQGTTSMAPGQALALLKPRSRLPHVDPRSALIETYVTAPRQRPTQPLQAPQSSAPVQVESPNSSYVVKMSAAPVAKGRSAASLAASAATLAELKAVMEGFEDCPLKAMATNMVFGDGNPKAPIMFVGEAPGAEEDKQGKPFVGLSGQLLDRMMASIGLDRSKAYITNMIAWRPPGNRQPSSQELLQCLPFVQRHIELVAPKILILVGGVAAKTLLSRSDGIMRMRGTWHDYMTSGLQTPIATTALFHPAYLLRSPGQKKEAWRDMQMIQDKLRSMEAQSYARP